MATGLHGFNTNQPPKRNGVVRYFFVNKRSRSMRFYQLPMRELKLESLVLKIYPKLSLVCFLALSKTVKQVFSIDTNLTIAQRFFYFFRLNK